MEAGEKELRQAFEEVTTRNVRAAVQYSEETRKLVRQLEDKVTRLEGLIKNQDDAIEQLKIQLLGVQARVFSGGT